MGFSTSTITRLLTVWQDEYQGWRKRSLAVADGVPGYLEGFGPDETKTEEQPCWVDKIANVLDKLPKRPLPREKAQMHEIIRASDLQTALEEIGRFATEFEARYQNAVHTLGKDQEKRLTFFNCPATRWIHLRTTIVIETTLATVKARTRTTK
jgi:putative transposase